MRLVPEEILALIFAFVREGVPRTRLKSDLEHDQAQAIAIRPLSETCKRFRRICLPYLFEAAIFDGSGLASRRRTATLVSVLREDSNIAQLARRVRIAHWRKTSSTRDSTVWGNLSMAFGQMSGVRYVEIRDAAVVWELFDHLQALPRLEDLSLTSASVWGSTAQHGSSQHLFGALKRLKLLPTQVGLEFYQASEFITPSLQSLHTNTTLLQNITSIQQIFPHFPDSLCELAVTSTSEPRSQESTVLHGLLNLCPGLESLRFPLALSLFHVSNNQTLYPLDGQILRLKSFEGRSDQALLCCGGRPVDTLCINLFPTDVTIENRPNLLRPGSIPLRHLRLDGIRWKMNTMAFISRHCPELRSLRVCATAKDGIVWMLQPMPRLQQASFLVGGLAWYGDECTADHYIGLLQGSYNVWPKLENLRLHPSYRWKRPRRNFGWSRVSGREDEDDWRSGVGETGRSGYEMLDRKSVV